MKKKLFYLGLAIAFHFSLFTTPCFAQGDTAWIHNTGLNKVRCIRISPDGQYVAAGFESGTISLFSADSGNFIRSFTTTLEYPSICFSPDGQWLVGGGTDSTIYIWDVESATLSKTFTQNNGPQIWTIDISPDGRYLLGVSGKLGLWDLENDSLILTISSWFYAKFSPNGKYFVTPISSSDMTNIYIYSMDSLKPCAIFYNLPWEMDAATEKSPLAWSSTGDTLAVATRDSLIYFIDVPQKSFVDTLHLTYNDWPVSSIRYFNNNLITGGGGGEWLFNYSTGIYNINNKMRINGYNIHALDLDIDSTGDNIVAGGYDYNNMSFYLLMLHSNDFFSSVLNLPEYMGNDNIIYPNPFNDRANLEFKTEKPYYCALGIYDFAGNQRETLYSGYLSEGEHFFSWYPNYCPSGTYFCKMNIGQTVKVIKLIYIK
jgi:WD40 repeat protein